MEHTLSTEIKSKKHMKHISVSNESHERMLFEGSLGNVSELSIIEGAVLEVRGSHSALRINPNGNELWKMLFNKGCPLTK